MSLTPGTKLGSFEIASAIGAGGMGEVYLARDTKLGREVAIKVLPEIFAKDRERLARFEREARLLASLNHPNIATIYDLEESNGTHFLVLELIPGETLVERIAGGLIPIDEAISVFEQIAEALEAAHEKGIIHRDLKPANIKVTPEGQVKVLDFGLAKALGGEQASPDLSQSPTLTRDATGTGVILGTAAYMSPEQARGKTVDNRTDIWAFGCVLYEALTGRAPFLGETVSDTLVKILEHEPDWEVLPEKTPPRIRTLLRRCLRKDARERFHHMGDVRIEVKEALDEPWLEVGEVDEPSRRIGWWQAFIWVTVGVIAAVAVGLWAPWRRTLLIDKPVVRVTVPTGSLLVKADWYAPIALSPDDRHLVYVAEKEGGHQLYLREMASDEAAPIPGSENGTQPFFSPDGQWIGFAADGKLTKVSLLGGPSLPLIGIPRFMRGASWGRDGDIVYGDQSAHSIRRVSVEGGAASQLTVIDSEKGHFMHSHPQILPGGEALLFVALDGSCGNPSVMVQSLSSNEQEVLIEGGTAPRYSPTGHIVYAKASTLVAVPFDLERLELTGPSAPLVEDVLMGGCGEAYYYLSENGSLAYIAGDELISEHNMLVWVDRQGNEELITRKPRMMGPRLSPDGKRIAVWKYGDDPQVWLYEFARDTMTQLTVESRNFWPHWTPDGQRLVFNSEVPGAVAGELLDSDLFWIPADGSGARERLYNTNLAQVASSWSPDGKQLIFHHGHRTPGFDIWVMAVDGDDKPWPFLATPASEFQGVLSPDGRWLAYVSNETGREEVYVTSFPQLARRWTVSTEGGIGPIWARNGLELFYCQGERMMTVNFLTEPDFAPRKPEVLFVGSYVPCANAYGRNYDVDPDGRFVMLKSVEEAPPTQVNIIFNWFEELKRRVPTH